MPSLTLPEARARAAQLSDVAYEVVWDLSDPRGETFGSRTTVRFRSSGPATFLELTGALELAVVVNGAEHDASYDGARIRLEHLDTEGLNEVVVEARLPYVADGAGMHRTVDPADGETYVGAYLGMDLAQRVLACFDQNDLKAPVTTTVVADPAWTVLANGRTLEAADGRWHFATTPPIPPTLLVVAAGPWASVRWEHAGLGFGWHARASLAAELERDAGELRAITERCFDHYAAIFEEPYPFDSYDQVFVPGLHWGAQEMPGCVTYRDELLPRGRVPQDVHRLRASVIAHEMSHMWFGDLMTMTWWEDSWLQESFADYLGYRVAEDGAGVAGALVTHEIARKPEAYAADERRSTHAVAPRPEEVPDVETAATIFDAISYAKGNSVLRQLATWLGDTAFLRGVNLHLSRHRFANATLADLVAALDEASDRDVRSWAELWLRRPGFDTLRVERDGEVPVLRRDGLRPHRVRVRAYDGAWREAGDLLVEVGDAPVPLPQLSGRVVVPNAHGETFARIVLDDRSRQAVEEGLTRVEDDLVRAVLWTMLLDRAHTGDLAGPAFVDLLARHLPHESDPVVAGAVLDRWRGHLLPLRMPADDAVTALPRVAAACAAGLGAAPSPDLALIYAGGLAATTHDVDTLRAWMADGEVEAGPPLGPALRWTVVRRLAELGAMAADEIEAERRRDPGTDAERGAATALAARPTAAAKAQAWAAAGDPAVDNRRFSALLDGLWVPEQAALLAPYVERYLRDAPRWAARGPSFAQVVGRARPALALTRAQVGSLDAALAGDLPVVLRRAWEDWRDDLGRADATAGGAAT